MEPLKRLRKAWLVSTLTCRPRLIRRILLISVLLFALLPTAKAEAPIVQSTVEPTQHVKTNKEAFQREISLCENPSQNPNTIILDVNNKYSYGNYMFQMGTWLQYKSLGATPDNILDPVLQEKIARYILDRGGWRNWLHCGERAIAQLGPYGTVVNE